jgi:hypothetical protein
MIDASIITDDFASTDGDSFIKKSIETGIKRKHTMITSFLHTLDIFIVKVSDIKQLMIISEGSEYAYRLR